MTHEEEMTEADKLENAIMNVIGESHFLNGFTIDDWKKKYGMQEVLCTVVNKLCHEALDSAEKKGREEEKKTCYDHFCCGKNVGWNEAIESSVKVVKKFKFSSEWFAIHGKEMIRELIADKLMALKK